MKIAYMHYHLKTGGVTTVLKQQLLAGAGQTDQLVITGHPPDTPLLADTVHIPEIGYSSSYQGQVKPFEVARSILKTIRSRFGGPCDVLHVHNPTLAKNRYLLSILKILQQNGLNLLLQIHDFAEDGRPLAYFHESYPADCHYGVINQRDYQVLLQAGLKPEGLHLLENTVTEPGLSQRPEADNPMVLYPIRAIRRKNIGEAILLSMFLKPDHQVAITLPPNSQADIISYRGWKKFAGNLELSVAFDQGLNRNFETLVMSAESLVSTSINEGFGFSFLEPWLFGKLLWGRRLVDVCRDFESSGIRLQHLYSGLYVPLEWIGLQKFRDKWHDCVLKAAALFNFSITTSRLQDAFDLITTDGVIDFGLLDESSQKRVILRLITRGRNTARMIQFNPFLAEPGTVTNRNRLIADNRQAVLSNYSPDFYRKKLINTYHKVSTTPINQKIDKTVLVSFFLNPENFSLLKWSDYAE
jgi:hypothetical protein